MDIWEKYQNLKNILSHIDPAVFAFSGGVDSTFLLKTAQAVSKGKILAVIFTSELLPKKELEDAKTLALKIRVPLKEINFQIESLDCFSSNPSDRCYHCKKHMFSILKEFAANNGFPWVADGSNIDDLNDFRPGNLAVQELGIRSPLKEAGLDKEEIRILSRELGLPTWNKPSAACLASRIPYGEAVTAQKLNRVEKAESFLDDLGFSGFRVRHPNQTARIEVPVSSFDKIITHREIIAAKIKSLGFFYVSLDLEGFRSGSMNEFIKNKNRG